MKKILKAVGLGLAAALLAVSGSVFGLLGLLSSPDFVFVGVLAVIVFYEAICG